MFIGIKCPHVDQVLCGKILSNRDVLTNIVRVFISIVGKMEQGYSARPVEMPSEIVIDSLFDERRRTADRVFREFSVHEATR